MKQTPLIKLIILICLLISFPTLAAPVGEHAGEIWIDGPEETQPGTTPSKPDAAVDKTGRSIFVWAANPAVNGGSDIYLRIFPADGGAPSEPVRVNTLLLNSQRYPRLAFSSDGSFLVIWQSNEVPDGGVNEKELVRSQAFDANAQAVGSEQLLSTLSTDTVFPVYADVAALRDGGYVVVWKSGETIGDDPNTSIQARRIGADGVPLAEQFQVNSTTANDQNFSAVTELSDGGFFVVWGRPEVRGRRFEADGTPDGDVRLVSLYMPLPSARPGNDHVWNVCAATSPARRSPPNASASMAEAGSFTATNIPSGMDRPMSCWNRWTSSPAWPHWSHARD